jgi:metallo-beta-lactamase class B
MPMGCLSKITARPLVGFSLLFFVQLASSQQIPPCPNCATWNAPQSPFRIYGNTYYVGPHGLSVILITSDAGHILIDAGLPESVPQIVAHIRALGFRVEDIKLIVNSHVHFDHAGGIAELQRLSGARVAASDWSAAVLKKGGVATDDPQFGIIRDIAPVAHVETLHDGETFRVGTLELTAHLTPGHTPGGTSWTWKSCEAGHCLDIVYADSLTPVSADAFQFTDHPQLLEGFQRSFAFLRTAPCDILLTTHPDASRFWDRVNKRVGNAAPDALMDAAACRQFADFIAGRLTERLASEKQK